MVTKSRLIYLIIYVRDLVVARNFYEGALGFRVLEEDAVSVKYVAGHVILYLQRAADFGIQLQDRRDRSIDITFLVDDFEGMRTALAARGIQFSPTLAYSVGKTTDFYDPDGHWFSLYEPSATAMSWPSGEKIRTLRRLNHAHEMGANGGPSAGNTPDGLLNGMTLDGHELIYLFLFVQDPDATLAFYHETLGFEAIEGGPCRRVPTSAPRGVVKYDAGGTLLTTHHVEGDAAAAKYRVSTAGSGGVALTFHVTDIRTVVAGLVQRGVAFPQGLTASADGMFATFADPGGHIYHLYEPSAEALMRPSGFAIERILAAQL